MISGIGTDIVQIRRMAESLEKYGERFARRILADREFQEFEKHKAAHSFLAKRFAAKEAAVKALGTGFRHGISMKHIIVDHDQWGKPVLVFTDMAQKVAEQQQITQSHLSIADEQEFAVAYVVLEKA